ncbi:Uncharacterised protein [Serratia marcescens]|nr:Uncharacterised protein [Serratia marcescens]
MSSRLTKKSLVSACGRWVNTPCGVPPTLAPSTRSPPTSTVISGAVRVSNCALSTSSVSAGTRYLPFRKLRKPSASGSIASKESTSVCSCEASMRPGANGTVRAKPAFFAACSTPAAPASTIRSASETRLPPACASLKARWMLSSLASVAASCAGWLTAQSFCGARRMRAPLAPPRLSEPRKLEAEAQAVETSADTGRPEASTAFFSAAMSCSSISG